MWLWMALAHAACPDLDAEVRHSMGALTLVNLDGAREDLADADLALACGPAITVEILAKYWVSNGVLHAMEGRPDQAKLYFAAAKRMDAGAEVAAFGEVIANSYTTAEVTDGTGQLRIAPELGSSWRVTVDGQPLKSNRALSTGLHVVQILEQEGPAHLAQTILIGDEETLVVEHDLPDTPPPPPRDPIRTTASLWVSAGTQLLVGNRFETAIDGQSLIEPSPKILIPVTFGMHLDIGRGWGRLAAQFAPLVNGQFIYAGQSVPEHTWFAWGLEAGGGAHIGKLYTGLMIGGRIPSRIQAMGVLGIPITKDWFVEPSLGIALPTDRVPEPAVGLNLGYRFRL